MCVSVCVCVWFLFDLLLVLFGLLISSVRFHCERVCDCNNYNNKNVESFILSSISSPSFVVSASHLSLVSVFFFFSICASDVHGPCRDAHANGDEQICERSGQRREGEEKCEYNRRRTQK